ncbi:MAG: hypothetical protein ACRDLQ_07535 [Solirubrobacterales bacterium]
MPAASIRSLVRRHRTRKTLGSCPACGHDVAADAGALAYRGGFYHLVCALWHRESHGRALVAR